MAGQDFGPVSLPMLIELAGGLLSADDEVRHGSNGEWRPARDIPELRGAFGLPELTANRVPRAPVDSHALEEMAVAENLDDLNIAFGPAASEADRASDHLADGPHDEWHARSLGVDFGPMPFVDLVAMAQAGTLGLSDRVRRESSAAWIPASEFPELRTAIEAHLAQATAALNSPLPRFGGEGPGVRGPDAPEISPAPAPLTLTSPPAELGGEGSQNTKIPADSFGAGSTAPIAILPPAAPLDSAVPKREMGPPRKRPPLRLIIAGAVGLIILAGLGAWLSTHRGDAQGQYDALAEVHQEIKLLRERRAPDRDWKRLTDRVKRDVMPWIDRLDKSPPSGRSAQYELLRAGKDHLLPMLGESRKRAGLHEKEFERHLENARAYLEGRPPPAAPNPDASRPVGIDPAETDAPAGDAAPGDSPPVKPAETNDPQKASPESKPPETPSTPDRGT